MPRLILRLAVDILLFLSVLGLVGTGLLMAFVLPPGSGGLTVWGSTRHDWGNVHFWLAVAMLAVAAVHVTINWGVVCSAAIRLCGRNPGSASRVRRNAAGAALLVAVVAIIGGLLWAASASIEGAASRGGRRGADRGAAGQDAGPAGAGGYRGGRQSVPESPSDVRVAP